ncbi:MAG: hypothetical protein QOJ50_2435 [Cryptosporangiaceae bacterium]|nr:hypothetical protein [Cryptosporangiaceae bacterium]
MTQTEIPLAEPPLPRGPRSWWPGVAVVAVLAVAAVTALAAGSREPANGTWTRRAVAQVPRADEVRVDLGKSLGELPFGPGRALSATPNSWKFGAGTTAKLAALHLDYARVWLRFGDSYEVSMRDPRPENWYEYLRTYDALAKTLVVNWRSDYNPIRTTHQMTEPELGAAERDVLADYKRHFPRIAYLEAENEPSDVDAYYPRYRFINGVVNAVNALGLPGPPIRVGGPVLDSFSPARLGRFLQLYAADRTPGKHLDFLAYHQYLTTTEGHWAARKDEPAMVSGERAQVDALLAQWGLPPVPVLVSETGVFPSLRASHPSALDRDLLIQAAGLASVHYFYAGQRGITPFHWTVDHPENDRKDLFSDLETGAATPYYKMVRMQSMLPATRYAASSDRLSAQGIGIYGLAAADSSRIAVMTWNYQWTSPTSHQSRVVVEHLPPLWRDRRIRVDRYKIAADLTGPDLAKVESYEIGARTGGDYRSPAVRLGPNELQLLVLTRI